MDLEEFQSFFPRVTSFFLYKKLFSNKAILEEKDFKNHLPSRAYYRYLTPTLLLHEDFVAFQIGSGSYYRRNIAELFHTVEALERALTQSNFSMKVEKEKEGKNGN